MKGNNTVISRVFTDRAAKKYDLMYWRSICILVCWEGYIEEGEIYGEARKDLGFLEKDYLDVFLAEQATGEADGDNDY